MSKRPKDGLHEGRPEVAEIRRLLEEHLRSSLLWRVKQVERLEAELARLRGERPDEDVVAVARWRRRAAG
jgi:hypothetical protein